MFIIIMSRLSEKYPVNALMEVTTVENDTFVGRVYTSDEISQSLVLQKPLKHTTLASEVIIINAASIQKANQLAEDEDAAAAIPLSKPLPKIQKKALEERERKALRVAEESFKHINHKASARGQQVYDMLYRACADVLWKDETIVVLSQYEVEPPYLPENCKMVVGETKKSLHEGLERVKKIVALAK